MISILPRKRYLEMNGTAVAKQRDSNRCITQRLKNLVRLAGKLLKTFFFYQEQKT